MPSFITLLHHLPFLLLLLVLQILFQLVPGSPSPILHYSSATYANHTAIPAAAVVPCLPDQESALLRLKRSFVSTSYSSFAFRSWRDGTDCCHWEGIECGEANGRVTTLDLGDCSLESSYLDAAVFELTSLRYLNLGGNDFNLSNPSSSRFERLTSLTYLNLSSSNFKGEVPRSIGRLVNLVSLDLSTNFGIVQIPNFGYEVVTPFNDRFLLTVQNFTALVANLGNLRELYLGAAVDLSQQTEWCNSLAKYTPNLRVLSLPSCMLKSPIYGTLSALRSLSVIDLQYNYMVGPFPNFFANFSFLSVLQLSFNYLEGWVSPVIFEQKNLVTIDIHENVGVSGSLPNFSADSCLQHLLVGGTNFSGIIPSSIGKVKSLIELGLNAAGFSGNLPSSLGELKSLNILKISGLGLAGPIPSWTANLTSLVKLQFSRCGLYGQIPSSIGQLINLRQLIVAYCKASGEILPHIRNITQLQILVLASNNFTGIVELNSLWRLPNLNMLDLSNNEIIAIDGQDNSSVVSFPNISFLNLASCGITKFPSIIRYLNEISGLDLSNNQIHGAIPQWALEKWTNFGLFALNFSHNNFTSIGQDNILPFYIDKLDLSFNMFQGSIPIPKDSGAVLDYSNNMFSSLPLNISTQLHSTSVFKASRNNISGNIPEYFSNSIIEFLDLSYNIFSGSIPSSLMEEVNQLKILNLRENQLHGELPHNINDSCMLEVLSISGNKIKGQLPKSLASCKMLEVIDIGNNEISGSFPCWMGALPRLQVLILNSNEFFGQVEPSTAQEKSSCKFPSLRILDLASNNFSGSLTESWFESLRSMMTTLDNETLVMDYTSLHKAQQYQVTTALTYKGSDITIEKILRTLVFIDVSNNALQGSIPAGIGELLLLNMLNMSHNSLTGLIPSQLGHLNQLESLDLSSNELSGKIPQELASLDSLAVLNLSDNKLVGAIPESRHFMTFANSSFLGNEGLCGSPLSKVCINTTPRSTVSHRSKKKSVDTLLFLFAGLGFGAGFAIVIIVAWGIPIRKWSRSRP